MWLFALDKISLISQDQKQTYQILVDTDRAWKYTQTCPTISVLPRSIEKETTTGGALGKGIVYKIGWIKLSLGSIVFKL